MLRSVEDWEEDPARPSASGRRHSRWPGVGPSIDGSIHPAVRGVNVGEEDRLKWILIFLSLSVTDDACNGPLTLVKHAGEIFDSQEDCEKSFRESQFYQTSYKKEIVGFCVGPLKPLLLSPTQLANKATPPKCH